MQEWKKMASWIEAHPGTNQMETNGYYTQETDIGE